METQSKQELKEIAKVTDEAIDSSIIGAHEIWRNKALESVFTICQMKFKNRFTANDVREYMALNYPKITTHDNRAMGGVMKTAMKIGWIKPSGITIVSKVGHKSLLQVWESKTI